MRAALPDKALVLTYEEAFALLEMCTFTLAAESPIHLRVLNRVGSLCREILTAPSVNETEFVEDRLSCPVSSQVCERLTIACLY